MPNLQELLVVLVCFSIAMLALLLPQTFPETRWFKQLPPPLWCYGLPMVLTGLGLLPSSSEFLQQGVSLFLPTALFLVLLPTPLRDLWQIGPRAIFAMLIGSLGIVMGGPIAYGLFRTLLPAQGWRSLSLLSGSWIGGSLNMLAIREALQVPEPLLGPMILVDSLVAYSWFAFLLFLLPHQTTLDHWLKAQPLFLKKEAVPVVQDVSSRGRWRLIGLIFFQTLLCFAVSTFLPSFFGFSKKTWGILFATCLALLLSQSTLSKQQKERETAWGQFLLYAVLCALGFQGNFRAFFQTPIFLLVGVVWVAIHAACLLLAGKYLRLPLGLLATVSQANIGGVVSTPLVGAAYHPNLVSIGLLLAILGNILGTPLGLLCAYLMRLIK